MSPTGDVYDDTATRPYREPLRSKRTFVSTLTILCHPDVARVGERTVLTELAGGRSVALSRLEPRFVPIGSSRVGRSLDDPHVSRRPFDLAPSPEGGIVLDATGTTTPLWVDGSPLATRRVFNVTELARGVVLTMAHRIVLVLRHGPLETVRAEIPGILGESFPIVRVRQEILRVADRERPVLLRGESGTGKELVARAIHDSSPRRDRPYLALNMGAIPRELAAAELFGVAKGAFTGADRSRPGLFRRADSGTLFLDEIATASPEVQALLLRTLDSGQIQPVGSDHFDSVDVRVLSATDADLEAAIENDSFRSPLLHRLVGYEMTLPSLRDRLEDFGRLFFAFLMAELKRVGESHRLSAGTETPWVRADDVARLALLDWPGNVRQLENVVRQIVVASHGTPTMELPATVERSIDTDRSVAPRNGQHPVPSYRDPRDVDDDEMIVALRTEGFNVSRTAARLRLSKTALYKKMDRCPSVRKASEVTSEEIAEARQHCRGNIEAMAARLEVSARGLRLRMNELSVTSQ